MMAKCCENRSLTHKVAVLMPDLSEILGIIIVCKSERSR
jgi:hypothetical protein